MKLNPTRINGYIISILFGFFGFMQFGKIIDFIIGYCLFRIVINLAEINDQLEKMSDLNEN